MTNNAKIPIKSPIKISENISPNSDSWTLGVFDDGMLDLNPFAVLMEETVDDQLTARTIDPLYSEDEDFLSWKSVSASPGTFHSTPGKTSVEENDCFFSHDEEEVPPKVGALGEAALESNLQNTFVWTINAQQWTNGTPNPNEIVDGDPVSKSEDKGVTSPDKIQFGKVSVQMKCPSPEPLISFNEIAFQEPTQQLHMPTNIVSAGDQPWERKNPIAPSSKVEPTHQNIYKLHESDWRSWHKLEHGSTPNERAQALDLQGVGAVHGAIGCVDISDEEGGKSPGNSPADLSIVSEPLRSTFQNPLFIWDAAHVEDAQIIRMLTSVPSDAPCKLTTVERCVDTVHKASLEVDFSIQISNKVCPTSIYMWEDNTAQEEHRPKFKARKLKSIRRVLSNVTAFLSTFGACLQTSATLD